MNRNQLWQTIKEAKTYQFSCLHYSDKKRKSNRRLQSFIVIVAAAGAPCFPISHWIAFGTTIAASLLEFFKSFTPLLCQPAEELCKVDDLATSFGNLSEELSNIWFKNEDDPTNEAILSQYKKATKDNVEKITLMNKLIHSISKKQERLICERVDDYLTSTFY